MNDFQCMYRPVLFPDAPPFLEELRRVGARAFILSNNPAAQDLAKTLGIDVGFVRFFTPRLCPGSLPKPHTSMWNAVLESGLDVRADESVVVGDDPWSEAAFAEACGVDYWIVDRMQRYREVAGLVAERCVDSLLGIQVTGS